jgi:hypothetical protein
VGRRPVPNPSFLDDCEYLGFVHGAQRWRSRDGRYLYTWDSLHGEVDVFSPRGEHRGVMDAVRGQWIKDAIRGMRINV